MNQIAQLTTAASLKEREILHRVEHKLAIYEMDDHSYELRIYTRIVGDETTETINPFPSIHKLYLYVQFEFGEAVSDKLIDLFLSAPIN